MLLRRLVVLFSFGLVFFILPKVSYASNFTTDYHVVYTIDNKGVAHAVVNGTLTNTTSQYYATSYKIQLGFDVITSVKALDADGSIAPQVIKNKEGYMIALNFKHQAVGLGNKQNFSITFDTPTLAHHYGQVWEIDIPGISNPEDFTTFTVELKTPSSFGKPAYIKPQQVDNSLTFDKKTLGKSGISLAFGNEQIYRYQLLYHLHNANLFPITTQIALPPSTNYQDVTISNIDPPPGNVIEDKDGNWLAQYHLASAQNMIVTVKGEAVIHLQPAFSPETPTDLNDYIKPQQYWESTNPMLQQIANQLQTPQAIYVYVSNKLHYDFSRVTSDKPRLGALGALQNPDSAVCREFTDLFIALARAAHIPAREVDGFAYTDNPNQRPISQEKDILHVWPEYYDSQRQSWIMVDPTWGSTTGGVDYFNTLDLDHFAFVIKGENSNMPIPAGGYKGANDPISKDVQISFATDTTSEKPVISLQSELPSVAIAGFPIQGSIEIKNSGSAYIPEQILYLSSNIFTPHMQTLQIEGVPPFGTLTVPVTFNPTNILANINGTYTIRVADTSVTKPMQSKLFFLTPAGEIAIGVFIVLITCIIIKNALRKK
jgi:transglutaminase-like putative cysteine protease